jgi:hypothetical protein
MKSPLAFFRTYLDPDYNLRGMFRNFETGIFRWQEDKMFACWTPSFSAAHPYPTIVRVDICKIDISTGYRKEISRSALSTSLFELIVDSGSVKWSGDQSVSIGVQQVGTYDLQIEDSYGNEFVSNPFYLCQPWGSYIPVIWFQTNSPGALLPGCCDIFTTGSVEGYGTPQEPLKLRGDEISPGASKYYGTNSAAVKGFHALPAGYTSWQVSSGESEFAVTDQARLNIEAGDNITTSLTESSPGVFNMRIDSNNSMSVKALKISIIGL